MDNQIPRELAEALLEHDTPGARIAVGEIPQQFPRDIDTSNLRVLGHVARGRTHSVVVFESTQPDSDLSDSFRLALQHAGFEPPPQVRRSGFGADEFARMQLYSRNDATLMYLVNPRITGGSLLTIRVMPPVPKDRAGMMSRMRAEREEAPLPLLSDPPGARNSGGGSGGSGPFSHMESDLAPCLALEPVVAHYDRQLQKMGWNKLAADIGDAAACICYTFLDERGSKWCGTFSIAANVKDDTMSVAFFTSKFGAPRRGGSSTDTATVSYPI